MYVCMWSKNWLFSALSLENLLSVMSCLLFKLKCLQCGLLRPVSCTDKVIHILRRGCPLAPKYFFWALTAHHTLYARLASCSSTDCVLQRVFQIFSSSCAKTCTAVVLFIHLCSRWNFRLSLREINQARCRTQLQCCIAACAVLWKCMLSAHRICTLWNSSSFSLNDFISLF